ncbi:MAG: hypothetical protein HQL36_03600 [Alphaproteobacteria bacterium]|nr:hypothetical protein [Alphaproteobacteria bacterium]
MKSAIQHIQDSSYARAVEQALAEIDNSAFAEALALARSMAAEGKSPVDLIRKSGAVWSGMFLPNWDEALTAATINIRVKRAGAKRHAS